MSRREVVGFIGVGAVVVGVVSFVSLNAPQAPASAHVPAEQAHRLTIDHVIRVRDADEYGVACYAWNHSSLLTLQCLKVHP